MRDKERESTHTIASRNAMEKKKNSILCLVMGSGIVSTDKWWWLDN